MSWFFYWKLCDICQQLLFCAFGFQIIGYNFFFLKNLLTLTHLRPMLHTHRSSQWRCPGGNVFLKISQLHRKTPVDFVLNKVASLQICNFTKKRLQCRCFPVRFSKFLRTPILKNSCKRLLPDITHAEHDVLPSPMKMSC